MLKRDIRGLCEIEPISIEGAWEELKRLTLLNTKLAKRFHESTRLGAQRVLLAVESPLKPQLHEIAAPVLPTLHLGVHDAAVLALAVDVVHLGHERGLGHRGVEDMVEEDW